MGDADKTEAILTDIRAALADLLSHAPTRERFRHQVVAFCKPEAEARIRRARNVKKYTDQEGEHTVYEVGGPRWTPLLRLMVEAPESLDAAYVLLALIHDSGPHVGRVGYASPDDWWTNEVASPLALFMSRYWILTLKHSMGEMTAEVVEQLRVWFEKVKAHCDNAVAAGSAPEGKRHTVSAREETEISYARHLQELLSLVRQPITSAIPDDLRSHLEGIQRKVAVLEAQAEFLGIEANIPAEVAERVERLTALLNKAEADWKAHCDSLVAPVPPGGKTLKLLAQEGTRLLKTRLHSRYWQVCEEWTRQVAESLTSDGLRTEWEAVATLRPCTTDQVRDMLTDYMQKRLKWLGQKMQGAATDKSEEKILKLKRDPAYETLLDRAQKLDESDPQFTERYQLWISDTRAWTESARKIAEEKTQDEELSAEGKQIVVAWDGYARTPDLQGTVSYLLRLVGETEPQKRFAVALSFPGERRPFIRQVADILSARFGQSRILYDHYHIEEFARPNFDTHLQRLYHDDSELIVLFLCREYDEKPWCGLEWRAIRDLIKRKETSRIMFLRFDDAEIEGIYGTDGYIDIRDCQPDQVADHILKRLEINARHARKSSC